MKDEKSEYETVSKPRRSINSELYQKNKEIALKNMKHDHEIEKTKVINEYEMEKTKEKNDFILKLASLASSTIVRFLSLLIIIYLIIANEGKLPDISWLKYFIQ